MVSGDALQPTTRGVLRGPKMYPVFRSERKAMSYAQRIANETDHMMAVEQLSARRWRVTDCGELPPLRKEAASILEEGEQ